MPEPVIVTEPSVQPAPGSPPVDMAAQLAELQTRVTGLQTALNRKAGELQTAVTQVAEYKTVKDSLAAQIAEATTREAAYATEKAGLTAEAATAKDGLARLKEIAAKNPGLLAHDEQGLLRVDLKGPEFSSYLDLYAKQFEAQLGQVAQTRAAGSAPAAGGTRTPVGATREILNTQLAAASKSGDRKAFDATYDALLKLPRT